MHPGGTNLPHYPTTADELLAAVRAEQEMLNGLQTRLSHASTYTERRNLLQRIRETQDRLVALYTAYQKSKSTSVKPVTVFGTSKKPSIRSGLSVQMDISTDGFYFSNPAPKISHQQRVWVRLRAAVAQSSPFATGRTEIPERVRCTWVVPKGWTKLDVYGKNGRMEYFVSNPLTVTREFKAPSSGSTKAKFGCYVDPYFYIEQLSPVPPVTSPVEQTTVVATFATAGTRRVYTLTSNVLSSYSGEYFTAGESYLVGETDETFYYTDEGVYKVVREFLSGPYAGKWFVSNNTGIVINESETGDV